MIATIMGKDGCAVNAETIYGRFPVEPLNAATSLIFLLIVIYWLKKTKWDFKSYPLILSLMPIFCLGVVASFIHHACRAEKIWNTLSMLAVFYSSTMACVYIWFRISKKWILAFCYTMIMPFLIWIIFSIINPHIKITTSSIMMALSITVLVPAFIYNIKNKLKDIELLASSTLLFAGAMFFREADFSLKKHITHGTHFLWHILGAAAVFVFLFYIYRIDSSRTGEDSNENIKKFLLDIFKD